MLWVGKGEEPNPIPELRGGGGVPYRYSLVDSELCRLVAALWLSRSRNSLGLSGLSSDSSSFSSSGPGFCPSAVTTLVVTTSIWLEEAFSDSQPCRLAMEFLSGKRGLGGGG